MNKDFEHTQFPGKDGSDIHKPTSEQERQELINQIQNIKYPPKRSGTTLNAEEFEALMFAMFKKGYYYGRYEAGSMKEGSAKETDRVFKLSITELYNENNLTPPKL